MRTYIQMEHSHNAYEHEWLTNYDVVWEQAIYCGCHVHLGYTGKLQQWNIFPNALTMSTRLATSSNTWGGVIKCFCDFNGIRTYHFLNTLNRACKRTNAWHFDCAESIQLTRRTSPARPTRGVYALNIYVMRALSSECVLENSRNCTCGHYSSANPRSHSHRTEMPTATYVGIGDAYNFGQACEKCDMVARTHPH